MTRTLTSASRLVLLTCSLGLWSLFLTAWVFAQRMDAGCRKLRSGE
jgi:hypothetical protein